jgi:hypothetical protein
VLLAGKGPSWRRPIKAIFAFAWIVTGLAARYLAATRSFDNAETGLGSEIVMRVPQTEQ